MGRYEFYLLDEHDRHIATEMRYCADDEDAVQVGLALGFDNAIDIWQEGRRVARLAAGGFAASQFKHAQATRRAPRRSARSNHSRRSIHDPQPV